MNRDPSAIGHLQPTIVLYHSDTSDAWSGVDRSDQPHAPPALCTKLSSRTEAYFSKLMSALSRILTIASCGRRFVGVILCVSRELGMQRPQSSQSEGRNDKPIHRLVNMSHSTVANSYICYLVTVNTMNSAVFISKNESTPSPSPSGQKRTRASAYLRQQTKLGCGAL